MNSVSPHTQPPTDCLPGAIAGGAYEPEDVATLKARRLEELGRLRAIGMRQAEEVSRWLDGDMTPQEAKRLAAKGGVIKEFARVSRAVRQIITLEMELCGLMDGPDRDGWSPTAPADMTDSEPRAAGDPGGLGYLTFREIDDYDNRPLDLVVATLRKTLNAEAPPGDPFAPPSRQERVVRDDGVLSDVLFSDEIDMGDAPAAVEPAARVADFAIWAEVRERVLERASLEMAVRSRGPPG